MTTLKVPFSIGDTAWTVSQSAPRHWQQCSFCSGRGTIHGDDAKSRSCPDCFGKKGDYKYDEYQWNTRGPYTIGLMRAEIRSGNATWKWEYMVEETGVGSGQIWHEMFRTEEEAQAVADERNANGRPA